ncbi:MAG: hypothetical protein FJY58_08650 [Betaproteobacteria bacterium]|nr:hypothetical protein [Betaproteobacteria bacterium]
MKTWIVNPYGTLPGEGWRDYRSQMLAQALVALGGIEPSRRYQILPSGNTNPLNNEVVLA